MNHFLIVAAGGALGAGMRHLVNGWALRALGPNVPFGTVIVNIAGSLLMGLLIGALARIDGVSSATRLFLATGVLGGFTTFSAFSLDAVTLYERGAIGAAFVYVAASVVVSIAALFAGLSIMRSLG
ncbi:MAG TPA: fluoride efflux transporter CrcB [Rhizobiaceae bacterium]|nr:fluoride efflux transporter CrcB [Rhizobiaceae bacterium]